MRRCGVIDPAGTRKLERFLTTGIDEETHRAIGDLPRGRGLLGVLIREARPLRLHDIADDPSSVGFPRNHPPMRTFLGIPIVLRGVAYGNLYLTEKAGGLDFTTEDEELTQLLAAQAAVAIENARLYESSTRWLRQLEGLSEIGAALASEVELEPLLDLVARRMRDLVGARLVLIALPDRQGSLSVIAAAGRDGLVGMEFDRSATKVGRVLERGHTERVDAIMDDPEVDQRVARGLGITSAMYLPLTVRGTPIGIVAVHDKLGADTRFDEGDVRLAESLVTRAAIAVDLSDRVSRDALRRVVDAQEAERDSARTGAARPDGPGADVDPARPQAPRRRRRDGRGSAGDGVDPRARRLDAPGRPPAGRGAAPERPRRLRARCPHWSASPRTSPSSRISSSTSRPASEIGAYRPRRRPPCTGSCRRR